MAKEYFHPASERMKDNPLHTCPDTEILNLNDTGSRSSILASLLKK